MNKNIYWLLLVVACIVLIYGVFNMVKIVQNKSIGTLEPNEIENYKGENLSAINDLKENAIQGVQNIDEGSYELELTGLVKEDKKLSYKEVINGFKNYEKVVTLHCVEGWSATLLWQGVKITDLLDKAGVKDSANTVIFHASDGYTTSLPLDYIKDKEILLAHKINGVKLPPERGFPFIVVAESKYGYKWAKWVTKIELGNDPSYQGYWESRGYPNDANVK